MKNTQIQPIKDPFLCNCKRCQKFSKKSSPKSLAITQIRSTKSDMFKIGERVIVKDQHHGVVKYVGALDDSSRKPKLYVGLKLDENVSSSTNGLYEGKRYFHCLWGHGAMVRHKDVKRMPLSSSKLSSGQTMYPSYHEIRTRRKERSQGLSAVYKERNANSPLYLEPLLTSNAMLSIRPQSVSAHPGRYSSDPHDMRYKDYQKHIEQQRKSVVHTPPVTEQKDGDHDRWTQQFGGDTASKMANTLQKLRNAYKDGLHLSDNEEETDST